jgi:hypothetical protein
MHTGQLKERILMNNGVISNYKDILLSTEYLNAFGNSHIGDHDTTLMLSLDGAQLFCTKLSNFWLSIWGNFNLTPKLGYK